MLSLHPIIMTVMEIITDVNRVVFFLFNQRPVECGVKVCSYRETQCLDDCMLCGMRCVCSILPIFQNFGHLHYMANQSCICSVVSCCAKWRNWLGGNVQNRNEFSSGYRLFDWTINGWFLSSYVCVI